MRNDFTYRTYERRGVTLWGVYLAKKILYSTCRSEEDARTMVDLLNGDPYIFDRSDWKKYLSQRT